ncbi:hypothetical protein I4U23_019064 [Adineta vaga]|nr:hypothetical protein I4U23_019064 [Adineta vaga]
MAYRFVSLVFFLTLNALIYSNGQFNRIPRDSADLKSAIKRSIDLKCEYSGIDGDGQFQEWYRDNMTVNSEKPGHYIVRKTSNETTLTIKIFVRNDSSVNRWYVKTSKPGYSARPACEFGRIRLIASPQSIKTEKELLDSSHGSLRRNEGGFINMTCNIKPKPNRGYHLNPVKWEYSVDDKNYTALPAGVIQSEENITISTVKKMHRGYYRCTLNKISFAVLLRVKDQYAALWPFLGIVAVVLILVLIILIFEKRQKAARKAVVTNDEDHTKDPLVRSTNKSSDNDNKKRAIKA